MKEAKAISSEKAERMEYRQKIKNRFLSNGLSSFSEQEVMELLLFYAIPTKDTKEISRQLIKKGGSFLGAFNIPINEMKKIYGVRDQAATLLKTIPQLVHYFFVREVLTSKKCYNTIEELAEICVKCLAAQNGEVLMCIYLDNRNQVADLEFYSNDTYAFVLTNIRKIIAKATNLNSSTVVISHNHPTANLTPSSDDITSTAKLKALLGTFDIELKEHFIVCGKNWYPMMQNSKDYSNISFYI